MPIAPSFSSTATTDVQKPSAIQGLAELVGVPAQTIDHWAATCRYERYRTFRIKKRRGGTRVISAPRPGFLELLQAIAHLVEARRPVSIIAKGYVEGLSIFDHAYPHHGRALVLTLDLQNFFGTIGPDKVHNVLSSICRLPASIAAVIAALASDEGGLPQGAPTSPAISNAAALGLDQKLLEIASRHGLRVTRYADDICVSTDEAWFPPGIASGRRRAVRLGPEICEAVRESGFIINHDKTKLMASSQRQMVTGLVVNSTVAMPREWRRQLRVMRSLQDRLGPELARGVLDEWAMRSFRQAAPAALPDTIAGKQAFEDWLKRRFAQEQDSRSANHEEARLDTSPSE